MRPRIAELDKAVFDVCVIGAGANGTSSAQHLAAAGYKVLLVDKGDYGSGSSSRSSRLLHCGLRYLAPGASILEFVWHPTRFRTAMRMARLAMEARRQIVTTTPERVRAIKFHFPIWSDSTYRPWQIRAGLALLASMAPKDVPLEQRMLPPAAAKVMPLIGGLRDWDRLQAIAAFTEYQFEWPERLCVDAALDAERLGATVRNYTAATRMTSRNDGWEIELADLPSGGTATIQASLVVNMAGIWIDQVNSSSGTSAPRKVLGTKGIHIMVQLPEECADYGIATLNRLKEPLYCVPWRGLHYFGPTETLYEGNVEDIRAEDGEIDSLLEEANHLLPDLGLQRSDILFSWAGVRPLTYDAAFPTGKRSREIHDLSYEGMPNVYAMTAGPIMTHRSAGIEVANLVQRRLKPSGSPQQISYAARQFPQHHGSPPVVEDWKEAKFSDLVFAARHEHAMNLTDLMFRRIGVGWTRTMGYDAAPKAAQAVADVYGWDAAGATREAESYRAYLKRMHAVRIT